jgi:hypothetical protein
MDQKTVALRSYLLPIFAGICLSRIIQPIFFPLDMGTLSIDLGHISMLAVTIYATLLYGGIRNRLLWVSLGSSFDQLVYLAVKANRAADFYSTASVMGSLVFLAVSILIFFRFKPSAESSRVDIARRSSTSKIVWFAAILILIIGILRLAQAIALHTGIPNEDRSLIFLGYEIHHINTGLVLIYFAACCLYCGIGNRRTRSVFFGLLAAGIALVSDQVVYYALENVSDEAYNGMESFAGAVAVSLGQLLLLIFCTRRESRGRL